MGLIYHIERLFDYYGVMAQPEQAGELHRMACADIVIAVHLEVAPADPQKIQSLFSVLGRSVDVLVLESELRGLKNADIAVTVPLEKYNGFEYDKRSGFLRSFRQRPTPLPLVLLAEGLTRRLRSQ
jgi:hypothetical protein